MDFFGVNGQRVRQSIHPYQYKLIRGIDFYNHCLSIAKDHPNVEIIWGAISQIRSKENIASISINGAEYTAQYVFSSLPGDDPVAEGNVYYLKQHFTGWFINTSRDTFDDDSATLMDFRTSQQKGTTFFYVMPFSKREALVEYTLFSETLLERSQYRSALSAYCQEKLGLTEGDYSIKEEEFGCIPMTNFPFRKSDGRIINIGAAGGQTKPSSGYTFQFIQKNTAAIVEKLEREQFPVDTRNRIKFNFYDSVLLNILSENKLDGASIFTTLFLKNKMKDVFRFLDNETSFIQDLNIIGRLPTLTFAGAAIDHLFKKKKSSKL